MSGARWLNLVVWGLGDYVDGIRDYRSILLLIVNLLVWVGLLASSVRLSPSLFLAFWLAAPIVGGPVYWIGTQIIVGYAMVRLGMGVGVSLRSSQKRRVQAPPVQGPIVSEEP
jgi:hypothetical protein